MKSSSLQKRLGIGLTLGMTLLWLGATVGTWLVVQHELNEAFDSALEETAQRILPLAVLEISNREEPRDAQHVAPLKMHKEYLTYLVRDGKGQILMQSHDANPTSSASNRRKVSRRPKNTVCTGPVRCARRCISRSPSPWAIVVKRHGKPCLPCCCRYWH
jgi:hypothetical protein